jgi:hypothetical protein
MAKFLFAYRTNQSAPPSDDAVAAWGDWLESLGTNLADRGNPVFDRRALGNCGSETALGGYSFITAEDLNAALALAKGCPGLQSGGGVEVGELTFLS